MSVPLQEDLTLLVRPAAEAPAASPLGWWIVATVAALAVGLWLARRRCVATEVVVWPEAADLVALRALEKLAAEANDPHARQGVGEVSAVVRRFVEARFAVRAPNLTSEEFWGVLQQRRAIPAEFDAFWRAFLDEADAIKYAGEPATAAHVRRLAAAAAEFVRAAAKGEVHRG